MKILYITDLHGSERHYRVAFEWALSSSADLLVLGGDLCPDRDSPAWQAYWVKERFTEWIGAFRKAGGCMVVGVTGNHDTTTATEALAKVDGFSLINGRLLRLPDVDLLGFHLTPPSPFPLKDTERRDLHTDDAPSLCPLGWVTGPDGLPARVKERAHFMETPSLEEELALLPPFDPSRTIVVMHSPPAGGVLDLLPRNIFCGSYAIRNFLKKTKPMLSLHGHIHESPWMSGGCGDWIDGRLCINPGQEMAEPVWISLNPFDPVGSWHHSQNLKLLR